MISFFNVCRYTAASGGITDWVYANAVTGYQSPAAAGVIDATTYSYRAESVDLTQWEIGTGIYTVATNTLTRVVKANNLGTTAKVNFTIAPQVAIVALAEDLAFVAKTGDTM